MRNRLVFRSLGLLALCLVVMVASAGSAQAYRFGKEEEIHKLVDVTVKGAKDEPLYLGYKTTTQNIFAGVYINDDGYVLGVRGDSKKYYNMPGAADVARFQKAGLLPDPLPPYHLSWIDYGLGYSLWIIVAVMILWWGFDAMRKKRKNEVVQPPGPTEPTPPAA